MGADQGVGATPYTAAGLSETGRRETNEDAAAFAVFPETSSLRAFAVLCDGMGGHNAGEVASRLAVEILRDQAQAFAARPRTDVPIEPATIEAEVCDWIARVNREILQRGRSTPEQRGMGSTVALAMVLPDDRLVAANVGDSRIYLLSELAVRRLSVDHTALAEQRRALGSDSVAPEDEASSPFAHALTRSLGQEKKVETAVRSDVTLRPGEVVILTTDGVTDVLEAERFLTALESTRSLQETAEEIVRLALEAGSKDNISVALLARGTPARLGTGPATEAAVSSPSQTPAGGMLLAGAASAPRAEPGSGSRAPRYALFGAGAVALLAVGLAAGLFFRRAPGPEPVAARSPSPGPSPPPPAAAAPQPTPTPLPTEAPTPSPAPARTDPVREVRQGSRPPAPAASAAAREPAFRAPTELSDLKPLEYPPTPTDTPTATATPTASPTPEPTAIPTGSPSPAAPASSRTPRVSA